MRCPACGATNPDGASWCGQCLHRFDEPAPRAEPAPAAPVGGAPAAAPAPASPTGGAAEGFRRVGDDLEWACPSCGVFNRLEDTDCAVCGTSFVDRFRPQEPEPPRNWSQAVALSLAAPGAGHLAVGRYGSGVARLVLFFTWVIGAILLGGGAGSGATPAIVPLLVGAAIMWAGTLVDLQRLQRGEDELLTGRRLLWLVIGVLALLGVGLVASAMSVLR